MAYVTPNGPAIELSGLGLRARGNTVSLVDEQARPVAVFSYGDEGGPADPGDRSLTRAVDGDAASDWLQHPALRVGAEGGAEGEEVFFSPGRRADGAAFAQ